MDKMREEFEAWAKDEDHLVLKDNDDGEYIFRHVRYAWQSWKASRAALCVELPSTDSFGDEQALFNFEDAVQVALDKSGVRYE